MNSMDARSKSVNNLRVIRVWALVAVGAYSFMGMRLRATSHTAQLTTVEIAVAFLSLACVSTAFVFDRKYVGRAEIVLRDKPDDTSAAKRLRLGYLVIYVVSIAVALYGLVLHFFGAPTAHTIPFFCLGALMIFFFRPRALRDGNG